MRATRPRCDTIDSGHAAIWPYVEVVLVRVVAWLLAVVIVTGTAARAHASLDAAGDVGYAAASVDGLDGLDGLDGMMPHGADPVAVATPDGPDPVRIEASRSLTRGRMHAVLIFRPPRLAASR
jgi:hypothetical protein